MDNYEILLYAVVKRATLDYNNYRRKLAQRPGNRKLQQDYSEVRDFLGSICHGEILERMERG